MSSVVEKTYQKQWKYIEISFVWIFLGNLTRLFCNHKYNIHYHE